MAKVWYYYVGWVFVVAGVLLAPKNVDYSGTTTLLQRIILLLVSILSTVALGIILIYYGNKKSKQEIKS